MGKWSLTGMAFIENCENNLNQDQKSRIPQDEQAIKGYHKQRQYKIEKID